MWFRNELSSLAEVSLYVFIFCPTRATWPAHLIRIYLITFVLVPSINHAGPHHAGASSFLLLHEHPIFEHSQPFFFPLWHRPSVTLVLTRILAHWIGPVSNKCTKHSEKSLPLLPESYKQLNRIGISRETDRRTPGSGVFRLPSTFLWLGSRNCGWRQGRTRRSLLHPMFREQLCS